MLEMRPNIDLVMFKAGRHAVVEKRTALAVHLEKRSRDDNNLCCRSMFGKSPSWRPSD